MTDILYVVKEDANGKYDDLKMSLRSVAFNMLHVGNIYIVGAIPEWVDKSSVHCLPYDDKFKRKHKNILDCIEYAVKHSDIGKSNPHGMFMLSSDDHWYMRESDAQWKGGPIVFKGQLHRQSQIDEALKGNRHVGNYQRSLVETRTLLESMKMDAIDFSMHRNTWMSREVIESQEWKKMVHKAQSDMVFGCEPTCLMWNLILKRYPFWAENGFVYGFDFKAGITNTLSDVIYEVEDNGRACVSASDGACEGRLHKWLEDIFEEKCKYEG